MQLTNDEVQEIIDQRIAEAEKTYGKPAKLLILEIISLQKQLIEEQTRYIEVAKWDLYYPSPTISAMRNRVNNAAKNGFDEYNVVHRQGGRVYINEKQYWKWFKEYKHADSD